MKNFIFCLLLLTAACNTNNVDTLPLEKMEDVMWDLGRADEVVNYQFAQDSSTDRSKKAAELYNHIFTIHNTSRKQFRESFNYYQKRPDLLRIIFDSLQVKQSIPKTLEDTLPLIREVK